MKRSISHTLNLFEAVAKAYIGFTGVPWLNSPKPDMADVRFILSYAALITGGSLLSDSGSRPSYRS